MEMAELIEKTCVICHLCSRMKLKLSARGSLLRRLNSAPSPTVVAMEKESAEKENAFVVERSPANPNTVLEDHDATSQDSACVADPPDISFVSPPIPSRRRIDTWGSPDLESPQSCTSRSRSNTSPAMRSISFCSSSSVDDGFSELTELENTDELAPGMLGKLLTSHIIKENSDDESTPTSRTALRRAFSLVENKMDENTWSFDNKLTFKRPRELAAAAAVIKRRKSGTQMDMPRPILQRSISETSTSVLTLSNVIGRPDLIADFSRPYALPLVKERRSELTSISHDTLAALFRGEYHNLVHSFTVIDCRYPYEYEAGHIKGSINLYNPELVEEALLGTSLPPPTDDRGNPEGRKIIIFHCEFSLQRGPKLFRFLRQEDRRVNCYPSLHFPEIYLLNGGYSAFHSAHEQLCEPAGYRAMIDPNFTAELNKYANARGYISGSRSSLKRLVKF